ncbi:disks large-associated protein 5-like isoform X1 [Sinocyclocheilus anshuiensis]|uniref:Disks large-associated protein 5-like n=1 Tax=Sinocyclocheilus anshuiensis TaxID=1608454 RepID=A0A671N2A9_9TELE|nr:PREDICTED: disks large-associated protein 5-like isoform X1 [Sinocyclocheilus anshuiensis]
MDSRFAHLYKRDSSVSMIRLKMSRRRSQSQKENREKIQNLRRHLDQLPEIELSMDASSLMATQDKAPKTKTDNDVNAAAEERKKMLARYKENKMLQKEKEKREKEKKGVFKVGLYKPQPLGYLPSNTTAPSRGKITETNQSTRVTRSMTQNQKPAVDRHAVPKKVDNVLTTRASAKTNSKAVTTTKTRAATVEPSVRAPTTRSTAKTSAAVVKPVTDSSSAKTRSTVKCPVAPSSGREKAVQGNTKAIIENKPAEKKNTAVDSLRPEEEEPKAAAPSFAPQGFVFQPPVGLRSFEPAPLSPRSASAFLSPSFLSDASVEPTFPSPPKPVLPATSLSSPPPPLSTPPPDHPANPPSVSSPPPAPSSPQPSISTAPSPSLAPLDPQHDVAYFRAVMASETERLTGLSELWESRFDDTSIPEEMRDHMRMAVGQARLLIKERFSQFNGLVDDCDLGRGEKITTCTDLQGFWDMVYFQVEDVNKKFNALKEAEAREWKEEVRPVARKRVAKKPPVVGGKAGVGASAAAKSRLAAVKAVMRAKQAEQKATESSDNIQDDSSSVPAAPAATLPTQSVVFDGGFFQVESPVKPSGAVRRSCRITVVSSPYVSKFSTPGRQCRSTAVSHASPLPCVSATPPRNHQPDVLPISTPLRSAEPLPQSPRAPQISPDHKQTTHVSPDSEPCSNSQLHFDLSSTCTQPDISNGPENSPVAQSHDSPSQSELPFDSSETQHEECMPEAMLSPSSQEESQENISCEVSEVSLYVQPGADAGLDTLSQCSSDTSSEPVEAEPSVCAPASSTLMPSTPTKDLTVSTALCNEVIILANNRSPTSTDVEMTGIQDAEGATGLDFERYLQPTVRYSMSPVQSPAAERFYLEAVDVEMESPVIQAEECPLDVLATPTALPGMVFSPQTSQMSDNLLLFTPERKERVRQSVCERDLITFTPPTYK